MRCLIFLSTLVLTLLAPAVAQEPAAPPKPAAAPTPALAAKDVFPGLWVQEDSGGVLEFRSDGTFSGMPATGKWTAGKDDWVTITSGKDALECRWKKLEDGRIELRRFPEGKEDLVTLLPLKPAKLDLAAWKGRWVIRFLAAAGKTATGRAVRLEETGHFRTKEGGYYFRIFAGKDGGTLGYASGLEDQTRPMRTYLAGSTLVVFDSMDKPGLMASCLKLPE